MSDETTSASDGNIGSLRKKILYGVLALLLVALAYDYLVARPGVELAYDKIVDRSAEVNADGTAIFTNLDVRQLLGKDPSRTFNDDSGDMVEVFSWRSGLPIKTHDLFAIYKQNNGNYLFYRHAKFKYETSDDVFNLNAPMVVETDPNGMTDEEYEDSFAEGGGDGGERSPGGGGPGGRGGGGGFDPAARFAERDADGDGFLKGDEIHERAQENMDSIDSDGDDAISKDEMMAFGETMRARFAGGRGEGEGRPRGRSRPELEEEPASEAPATKEPASEEPVSEAPEKEPAQETADADPVEVDKDES